MSASAPIDDADIFPTMEEAIGNCIREAREDGEATRIEIHDQDCPFGYTGECNCEPMFIDYDPELQAS